MSNTRSFTQFQDIAHLIEVFAAGEKGKGIKERGIREL
jgi:hypothetical protein